MDGTPTQQYKELVQEKEVEVDHFLDSSQSIRRLFDHQVALRCHPIAG